jgi:hypothetical protein
VKDWDEKEEQGSRKEHDQWPPQSHFIQQTRHKKVDNKRQKIKAKRFRRK